MGKWFNEAVTVKGRRDRARTLPWPVKDFLPAERQSGDQKRFTCGPSEEMGEDSHMLYGAWREICFHTMKGL